MSLRVQSRALAMAARRAVFRLSELAPAPSVAQPDTPTAKPTSTAVTQARLRTQLSLQIIVRAAAAGLGCEVNPCGHALDRQTRGDEVHHEDPDSRRCCNARLSEW